MPRTNKITERVFADLAETRNQKGAHERFLSLDKEMGLQETPSLIALKDKYKFIAEEFVSDLSELAGIEEIIIQMRCKQVINSELRLSLSRNYIYARSLFYRRGNQINDIRVIVGLTEDFGTNLSEIINDQIFRDVATSKLLGAMDKEIEKNMFNLKLVYTNE
jgi:hypothetical protein